MSKQMLQDIQLDSMIYKTLVNYIEKNQDRFYRLAYSYSKDKDTALDIVQTAIYKALTSIDGLNNPDHIKTWFYRILVNASLDELRRSSRVLPMNIEGFNENNIVHIGDGKDIRIESVDIANCLDLYAVLNSLEPKERTLINLRYFEDMKLSEIAEVLGENLSSIKARLYRTLSKMKIQLKEEEL